MQLTKHTDISLRVLIYLAIHKEKVCTISEIAEKFTISRNHLVKVVHKLAGLGYIRSVQGRGGGIFIEGDLSNVRIGDVVRDMELTLDIVDCEGMSCPLTAACILKSVINDATRAFLHHLDTYTLDDLVQNKRVLLRFVG